MLTDSVAWYVVHVSLCPPSESILSLWTVACMGCITAIMHAIKSTQRPGLADSVCILSERRYEATCLSVTVALSAVGQH
jgi:hypothetical protein